MNAIIKLHNSVIGSVTGLLGAWFLPSLARFTFVAVLLGYFWNSALTKLGGGFFGFLHPNEGAFYQIFPAKTEALGFDISQFSWMEHLIVIIGTWAEFVLPLLIMIGLFTRLAAAGMSIFVLVQSFVDITGHGVDDRTVGSWFDANSGALVLDQRLLWMMLFAVLFVKGAGPLSLDRLLSAGRAR